MTDNTRKYILELRKNGSLLVRTKDGEDVELENGTYHLLGDFWCVCNPHDYIKHKLAYDDLEAMKSSWLTRLRVLFGRD